MAISRYIFNQWYRGFSNPIDGSPELLATSAQVGVKAPGPPPSRFPRTLRELPAASDRTAPAPAPGCLAPALRRRYSTRFSRPVHAISATLGAEPVKIFV